LYALIGVELQCDELANGAFRYRAIGERLFGGQANGMTAGSGDLHGGEFLVVLV
jgi:hypothetical protein